MKDRNLSNYTKCSFIIILLSVLFQSDWFSRGCHDEEIIRLLETFVFIENSTYYVKSPGDEFLFRAHFSTHLRSSSERRFVIYFIDSFTHAATVLKNRSLCSIIGYGLIEETLSVQRDGILLLRIFLHSKEKVFNSLFALTMVDIIELRPLTKKERKQIAIINRNLPYVNSSEPPSVSFPNQGLEIKTIQGFENLQDGIMRNLNYDTIYYNNHNLSNKYGLPIDVSAYNHKKGSVNYLKHVWDFLFFTFKNEGLFITYLSNPGWDKFIYFQIIEPSDGFWPYLSFPKWKKFVRFDLNENSTAFPYWKLYPRKQNQFFPLEKYKPILGEKFDYDREYFFNIQSMRRKLFEKKGFSAFQGCSEGEFIPFPYKRKIVWGVIKNGSKRVVNTDTWTYEIGGRNVSALFKEANFVTLLNKECMRVLVTQAYSTTVNPIKNLKLEDKETFLWNIWKLHDYPPAFITVKHEIYLPVTTVVTVITLLIAIIFFIFIRECITRDKKRI